MKPNKPCSNRPLRSLRLIPPHSSALPPRIIPREELAHRGPGIGGERNQHEGNADGTDANGGGDTQVTEELGSPLRQAPDPVEDQEKHRQVE